MNIFWAPAPTCCLLPILLVCGWYSCWAAPEINQTHQGLDSTAAFIETSEGVYEYVSQPLDRWQSEKACEYKFASLLSESKDGQKIPEKLLHLKQINFPIWLKEDGPTEPRTRPLTVLVFENRTDVKYAKLLVDFPHLPEITVCAFIQWENTYKDFATVFSYAVPGFFNEFQLRGITSEKGYVQFAIIVHGHHTPYSTLFLSDGQWHHVCVTWQKLNGTWAFYADGKKAASSVISTTQDIIEGGSFIIGQDQDSFGGTFKAKESFSGNITNLNVWMKVLSDEQIEVVRSCNVIEQGIIYSWKSHKLQIDPSLLQMDIQFVCPGSSMECQILQTRDRAVDYTPCENKLPFICYYTNDLYQRLKNTNRVNRQRTFSSRVNAIANRTLISENLLDGGVQQLNVSEASASLQAIERVMETDGSLEDPADLLSVIQFLKGVADIEAESGTEDFEELSYHFVKVTGAILEQPDAILWSEVNPIIRGPMTLVLNVDKMASTLSRILSDEKKEISIHHRNIEVGVRQVDLDANSHFYREQSTNKVDQITVPMKELKGIAKGDEVDIKVVNTWFDFDAFQHLFGGNTYNFLPEDSAVSDGGNKYVGTYLGSAVISSTVFVGFQEVGTSVQYRLWQRSKIPNDSRTLEQRPVCAFWNFSINPENGGGWSTSGCHMKKSIHPGETVCFCNHTTNFAVLLQLYDVQRNPDEEWTLRTLTFIGCGVSLCALLVTFILFLAVGVPKSERTTVHKNLIFALAAAESLLMFSELAKNNEVVCITVTASLHLFFMAAFAWMLVEGLLLWSKVVAVNMSEDRRMRFYYITGWGLPIIIVSVTLATSFNKYVADSHCWLNVQTDIIWAFVGPVLFILTVNTFVLFRVVMVTISSARRRSKMLTPNCSLEKQIGIQVWATAKPIVVLLPVLGLTWLCGVLVHLSVVWAYVFIALNSFQGLYIFLIYAIYNSEVRNAIQRMKDKKKALSFTNCSNPTNYVSSQRNTIWETGKSSLTPPSSISSHPPLKNTVSNGNLVAKNPVNISSILSTDTTVVELTAFKTSEERLEYM
ncbi:adhesion G-protein coupled receptor D2 isoform X1 [Xenopus tropicalis]|uniref:Adhesion G-protein coupled receptor D2 isoform X1 n=1 Tax=Xenopus tropicalis TaxID=8364 RepID=A0A8J0S9T9_XENTR|nr:adhesion G-protein coupled receptor D2 isoform X1 [Xenopus tropicalis]